MRGVAASLGRGSIYNLAKGETAASIWWKPELEMARYHLIFTSDCEDKALLDTSLQEYFAGTTYGQLERTTNAHQYIKWYNEYLVKSKHMLVTRVWMLSMMILSTKIEYEKKYSDKIFIEHNMDIYNKLLNRKDYTSCDAFMSQFVTPTAGNYGDIYTMEAMIAISRFHDPGTFPDNFRVLNEWLSKDSHDFINKFCKVYWKSNYRICRSCSEPTKYICKGCAFKVYYCSDACAKKDWKKHMVACKAYRVTSYVR
jgi:hypothetical protein